jgi:uncharacterized protein YukE
MTTYAAVVARIGQMPVGDPAAMQAHAQRLRSEASQIAARAAAVTAKVSSARYECPAADRLRHDVSSDQARLIAASERLNALADTIASAASRVQSEQAWWQREFHRVSAELASAGR